MAEPSNLPMRAARGAFITFAGQLIRIVTQAVGVILLARLLTPTDFGLVAMVVAIAGFGEVVREMGLGIAAIQARNLTTQQRSNLFWLNTLLGFMIGAVLFFVSWPLAALYGDERVVGIAQIVSVTFVFSGMAAQYRASLQRDLRYSAIVGADVVSMAAGVLLAITMAFFGFGYWSIVGQQVVQPVVGFAIVLGASRWLPRAYRRHHDMRAFISFGWHIFGYQLLTYASRNIDTIIVGARFGAASLGYYNRAFQLVTVPLGQFLTPSVRMAISVLSKLQDDPARFSRYLRHGQNALVFVSFLTLSLLFGTATAVVDMLLGSRWSQVVPLFQILAVAGVFQVMSYPTLWAYLALGLSRENLRQALVSRSLLIAAVVIGSFFSVEGIAIGYAIGMAVAWPISVFWLARVSILHVSLLVWNAVRQAAVFAVGACATSYVTHLFATDVSSLTVLAIGVGAMAGYVGLVLALWPSFRADARDVLRAYHFLRGRRK